MRRVYLNRISGVVSNIEPQHLDIGIGIRNHYRMQIAAWLQEEELTLDRAARAIGAANRSVVQRHLKGHQIPNRELMRQYVIASEGRVTPNDIYGLSELIAECLERRARRLQAKKNRRHDQPELDLEAAA